MDVEMKYMNGKSVVRKKSIIYVERKIILKNTAMSCDRRRKLSRLI